MRRKYIGYNLFVLILFTAVLSFAANIESNSSPYDVVYNHYHFMKKNSYDELQAAGSFNIPNKRKRIKAAVMLKEILDVKMDVGAVLSKIPDDPNYSDSSSKRHIFVLYDKMPQIFVEKIDSKWYYSQSTVDALPVLHNKIFPFGTNIWAKWFPVNQNEEYLRLHPWQWIGIGIIFGVFLICFFLLKYLFRYLFYKILFKRYANEIQDFSKLKSTSYLFSVWVGLKVVQIFLPTLFINPNYAMPLIKGLNFVAASIFVLIVYKLVELFMFYAKQYASNTTSQWDDQIVIVLQKFLKFVVIFLGLFYVLNTLDVNIATIIAGLSVGGLALALAAQDTVKNFIASVMIFIDKPFKIGDTIKVDTFEGAVQEVGFRSTRIKTTDESIVYIGNSKLSEMIIDNKGSRVLKKYKTEIIVSHDTSLVKLENFLEGIKIILTKYPFIKNSTVEVHLTQIQATGLSIFIKFTYKIHNQREEMQHREFVLLKILSLADLLQIKLFENNNLQHSNEINNIEKELSANDMKHQLNKFFAEYDDQLTSKIK